MATPKASEAIKIIIVGIILCIVMAVSVWACRRYAEYKGFSSPSSESGSAASSSAGPAHIKLEGGSCLVIKDCTFADYKGFSSSSSESGSAGSLSAGPAQGGR